MKDFYSLEAQTGTGEKFEFSALKGKTVLIVNTASKCGFTPQYEGLEELHKKFAKEGLVILGFPCDQFGHQEPGTDAEIAEFCKLTYGVSFKLMKKVDVNGSTAHPVFVFLRKATKGLFSDKIKWNFTKFLISQNGETIRKFSSNVKPSAIAEDIQNFLL